MSFCTVHVVVNDSDPEVDGNFHPRGLDCIIMGAFLLQFSLIMLIISAILIRCCVIRRRRKRKKKQQRQQLSLSQNIAVSTLSESDTTGPHEQYTTTSVEGKTRSTADGYSLVKLRDSSDSAHKTKEQSSPEYSKLTSKDGGNSPGNSPGYYKLTNNCYDASVPKSKNSNINPKTTPPPLPSDPPPHGRPQSLMFFTQHNEPIIQLDNLPKGGPTTTTAAAVRASMFDPSQQHTATTPFKEDCDSDDVYSMAGHGSVSLDNLTVGGESDAHYSVISRPSSVCTSDDIYDNADKNLEPVDYEDFYSVPNDIDEADDSEVEEEESMADNKTSSGKEEKISKTEENICNVDLKIDPGDLGVGTRQGTTAHIAEAGPPPRGARFMSKIPPPVASRRPRSVSNNIELSSNFALETNVRSFRHGLKPANNNPLS